jgi:hypothetical protein
MAAIRDRDEHGRGKHHQGDTSPEHSGRTAAQQSIPGGGESDRDSAEHEQALWELLDGDRRRNQEGQDWKDKSGGGGCASRPPEACYRGTVAVIGHSRSAA